MTMFSLVQIEFDIFFRTLEDEFVRSASSSSLVDMFNKTSDEMNRTMLRQLSQANKTPKRGEDDLLKVGEEEEEEEEEGKETPSRQRPTIQVEEEKGSNDSKVISVNVVILHSASSPLLHDHLSTRCKVEKHGC